MTIEKINAKITNMVKKLKKVASDDPRRVVHSFKMGLALTVVSMFYYLNPLYNGFGISAIWAVLTVVVVMEFTVGGTLGKGVNRSFATLVAGALGVGAHYLANLAGHWGESILLSCFVFFLASAATFSRFVPEIKARYDYGALIFILTFSLVAVSSYRVDELIELAHQRLSTVAIGGATCVVISLFLFPVWAGGDLHDLTSQNLEKLSTYLEGLASDYFGARSRDVTTENKVFLQTYKSILNSKASEESLANLARWEPCHGRFGFRHPWKQYLLVGASARQCAYRIEALATYITKEVEVSSDIQRKIRETCKEMCLESSRALKELALAIHTMTDPSKAEIHVANASLAASKLKTINVGNNSFSEILLHDATIASILSDVVVCVQSVAKSTEELSSQAKFRKTTAHAKATVNPISEDEGSNNVDIIIHT